jgi:acyl carrier protein
LHASLSGIASLLVPGGTVVLLETTRALAWHDISTGLIEGWQKSEDDLRGGNALLGTEEWAAALRQAGFEEVVSAPGPESPAGEIGLHVILARGPAGDGSAATAARTTSFEFAAQENAWRPEAHADTMPGDASDAGAIATMLKEAPPTERREILFDLIAKEIAQILRLGADAKPKKRERLMDLGMDSLMAVELRNRLSTLLAIDNLPATLMFDYPTPDAIAGYLLDRIEGGQPAETEGPESRTDVRKKVLTAEEVEELSEDDVTALLRSRLA